MRSGKGRKVVGSVPIQVVSHSCGISTGCPGGFETRPYESIPPKLERYAPYLQGGGTPPKVVS